MLQVTSRRYRRPFKTPLRTHHGLWTHREGIIVRLASADGRVGWGEIAPIPWFGTETLAAAWQFCAQRSGAFDLVQLAAIPDRLPACQFGFATAVQQWQSGDEPSFGKRDTLEDKPESAAHLCGLLPTGAAALAAWRSLWQQGHRTFKWKIGVAAPEVELPIFQALAAALPAEGRLRLDANGGLTPASADGWLRVCDQHGSTVEFLEQPLPPDCVVDWLLSQADAYATQIALDESVATFTQLQAVHQRLQNRVVYVLKPAIAGQPDQLLAFCRQHRLEGVISSALETPVGRRALRSLVAALRGSGLAQRALGLGVGHWFEDDWQTLSEAAIWRRIL